MDDAPDPSGTPPHSAPPLERIYYLHYSGGTVGPMLGSKIKELIENGAVPRDAHVNLAGAPEWTPILAAAPFAGFFPTDDAVSQPASARAFAGFWVRLAAYAIDQALTMLATGAIAGTIIAISDGLYGGEATDAFLTTHTLLANVVATVIALFYYGYFMAGPWQATPGKRLLGIYVIRVNGERMDAASAVLRYLAYVLSILPFFVGFLMVFWTPERKALHDIVCGTRVVYGRP